jgi:hypothetical protein
MEVDALVNNTKSKYMDQKYKGLREDNGVWEEFAASSPEEATPEITGYSEVVKL